MPRPKTVSDQAIIAAALDLLSEKGAAFSLSDIARAVGLSRATVIQRFGSREDVLMRMSKQHLADTQAWLDELLNSPELNKLDAFLEVIVDGMGDGSDFSTHVAIASLESRDPKLTELAGQRYAMIQSAIADRLLGEDAPEKARLIHSIIAGASMQWIAGQGEADLPSFIKNRLLQILPYLTGQDS